MRSEQAQNARLYLEFRKTYLMLLASFMIAIEQGNVRAAELYPELEEAWRQVETWYRRESAVNQ